MDHFAQKHHTNQSVAEGFFNLGDREMKLHGFPYKRKHIKITEEAAKFGIRHPEFFDLFRTELRRRYFLSAKPIIEEFQVHYFRKSSRLLRNNRNHLLS